MIPSSHHLTAPTDRDLTWGTATHISPEGINTPVKRSRDKVPVEKPVKDGRHRLLDDSASDAMKQQDELASWKRSPVKVKEIWR